MPGMTPEEFRRLGYEAVDWIAGYLAGIRERPVASPVAPGDLTARLPTTPPEAGEPMDRVLADFRELVMPAVTHWNHPRFLAYFAVSGSEPGILGEMLTAALNVNGMIWATCPALTELEVLTLDWLRQWLGLPEGLFGMIHDTASTATVHAVIAAREHTAPESRVSGNAEKLVLYCSEHANFAIEKAALAAGIGRGNIRKIPADADFRLRADSLRSAIERDVSAGLRPFCVVATVGTTSSASIDPVAACADLCAKHGMWLHVDGAYGASAAVLDEMRWVLDGVDRADSFCINPHKWLLTQVDCSALYTRRPEAFRDAFSLTPEYLRSKQDPRAVNLMDHSFVLGRRFRALKLWFVMRYYGRAGIAAIIRRHIEDAREFVRWLEADERFEIAAPPMFSLVCFRRRGSDEANRKLVEAVNQSGLAFLSGTVLSGRYLIRLAIGHHRTTRGDLGLVWEKIQELADTNGDKSQKGSGKSPPPLQN
jgi:aromatic-L-amino-acid decarboxylase